MAGGVRSTAVPSFPPGSIHPDRCTFVVGENVWARRLGNIVSKSFQLDRISGLLFALGVWLTPPACFGANDISTRILHESRFENWQQVLALSRRFSVEAESDIPALVSILNSCVALGCQTAGRDFRNGKLAGPQLQEFIDAWIEFTGSNPRNARDRFVALSNDAAFGWLGRYGLLCYAIETENAALLRSTLQEADKVPRKPKPLIEKLIDARFALVGLSHDYEALAKLLESERGRVSEGTRLSGYFTYLASKDDFSAAQKQITKYVSQFGMDHDVAKLDVDLKSLLLPPSELLRVIDSRLKKRPNYWTLHIAKAQVLLETSLATRQEAALKSLDAIPAGLVYAQLLKIDFLVRDTEWYKDKLIGKFQDLLSRYDDYPILHVAAAEAFMRTDSVKSATEQLDKADDQTSLYVPAILVRAALAVRQRKFSEAIELHKKNVNLAPNSIFAKLYLAQTYALAKDYIKAKQLLGELRRSRRYIPREAVDSLERNIDEAISASRR